MKQTFEKYKTHIDRKLESGYAQVCASVEAFEALNEIQEWKVWKQNKDTNWDNVLEEIADVIIFMYDYYDYDDLVTFVKTCFEKCSGDDSDMDPTQFCQIMLADFEQDSVVTQVNVLIGFVCHYTDKTYEDLESAVVSKLNKNINRKDHKVGN